MAKQLPEEARPDYEIARAFGEGADWSQDPLRPMD
jgi:hypothetical protein